jgi:predicted O-methyltransferase YrrM
MHELRSHAARAFIRRPLVRRAIGVGYRARTRSRPYDLSHLSIFAEYAAAGPIQRDEALLLFALTRMIRPRVIVEIGFLFGRSALNFLQAMPEGAQLHSFDISADAEKIARTQFSGLKNFTFHRVSQSDIGPEHVGGRVVELVFLDASHDLALNQRTFERLQAILSEDAIMAVHDTGTWPRELMGEVHRQHALQEGDSGWLGDDYQHQRQERQFVNWVADAHPEYAVLHLHSTATLRHGITLLQRRRRLPVDPSDLAPSRAQGDPS